MCRYGMNTYKPHYACFNCRKTFKRPLKVDFRRKAAREADEIPAKCPECGELMANMGLDFEAPKKQDVKAWQHIKDLYTTGITFHSCGCTGPGYIPRDKQSLIKVLENRLQDYIGQRRFWSSKEEPESNVEKKEFWRKNALPIYRVPRDFVSGTRKTKMVDIPKAIVYWSEKVDKISRHIDQLKHSGDQ